MEIKEFLNVIPKQIDREEDGPTPAGICIRYRVLLKKWYVSYGYKNKKYCGFGDTPEEAINDFMSKALKNEQ